MQSKEQATIQSIIRKMKLNNTRKGDFSMSEMKDVTIEDILNKQKENYPNSNTELIRRAYEYAKENHGDQCRKSGEPYMIHPMHVAYILAQLELDDETLCAALLHDVVEDTPKTH